MLNRSSDPSNKVPDLNETRNLLPANEKRLFDDIVEQRVLGASRHIAMIGEMFESIAVNGQVNRKPVRKIIDEIAQVADFFIRTRGEASQAVSNAILLMTRNLDSLTNLEIDQAVESVIQTKNSYTLNSNCAMEKILVYAKEITRHYTKIFVYDYSSTVDKLLKSLKENGKKYTVYIAESRAIDGGYPFVETCQNAGHKIVFIPDAAIMYYLKECEVAFMGAETFYPDGTGFNTIGSDIVGLVCDHYKIPLYFLTPLIKLDIRPIFGFKRTLVINNLKDKLTKNWRNKSGTGETGEALVKTAENMTNEIDFNCPELIGVEPKFITGFVTERGIIPSGQMYELSLDYYKELKGEEKQSILKRIEG